MRRNSDIDEAFVFEEYDSLANWFNKTVVLPKDDIDRIPMLNDEEIGEYDENGELVDVDVA
jgi:hypothetical protein